MKRILFALMILAAMASCKRQNQVKNEQVIEKVTTESIIDLPGKTLEYDYGDYVYQIDFKSDSILHWECIKGDEKGANADENYATQRLNAHTFFISWVEESGLGVSQVINLKENVINCYLKIDKDIIPLEGKIREI
ncbi:MoaF-related domain-containing protein [Reichenbachiella versicolor]|uniref:MoaF-related domain-containing protein n=1 Tax=Reichenbachiella versicolor TaxID=1821036 RepID=UPI000D6E4D79|nr:MoaF N-terminal domain-containing protein [Reichenbachiella versicolor]